MVCTVLVVEEHSVGDGKGGSHNQIFLDYHANVKLHWSG